jgi:hypothetical protein
MQQAFPEFNVPLNLWKCGNRKSCGNGSNKSENQSRSCKEMHCTRVESDAPYSRLQEQ